MIHSSDVKRMLSELRDVMIEEDTGVSPFTLAVRFDAEYPHVRHELAGTLYDEWLHLRAAERAKPPKAQQQTLPGIGDVPNVVTTFNGEGEYVYKRLHKASEIDLINNEEIQRRNAEAAVQAADEAARIRQALVPVMQAHNFATAGDAIAYLAQVQP